MVSERERAALLEGWAKQLAGLITKGSVPGEIEGFTPPARKEAALLGAEALCHRAPLHASIALESFARKDGERQMRLAIANDDMPFLVDTVAAVIARHGLIISRLLHPVINVSRTAAGDLIGLGKGGTAESLIYIECDRGDARTRMAIREELRANLEAVRAAVADWHALEAAVRADASQATGDEGAFLSWAADGHFTLLGKADFPAKGAATARLGLARAQAEALLSAKARVAAAKAMETGGRGLLIVKSNLISPVHRAVPLDLLIIPVAKGGIRVHAGLWTSGALGAAPDEVPILAARLAALQASFGFSISGHAGKALTHAVGVLPHDIAVSVDEGDLQRLALTAMSIADRPRIAVELVRAPLDRHVFGFVWLPRDELTTARRVGIGDLLSEATGGTLLNWSIKLDDGGAAGLRYMIDVRGSAKLPDQDAIEAKIEAMVRGWPRAVEASLAVHAEPRSATRLALRFTPHFPQSYRDHTPAAEAALDIMAMASLDQDKSRVVRFGPATAQTIGLKIIARGAIALSDAVPALENFGFRVFEEVPTALGDDLGDLHDFQLSLPTTEKAMGKASVEAAIAAVLEGRAENDRFNALMVSAGLDAQAVLLMRALFRYLRQTGMAYGLLTVVDALNRYPDIARDLVRMFVGRHSGTPCSDKQDRDRNKAIDRALAGVSAIDDDRILRQYRAVIRAVLRTNMFVSAGQEALAFKIDSAVVPGLPAPVPWREIFVYSPRVEGIHLRAGPVARGGLRWSDRRDDFRTEVLGLMKAQRVKNAVIVPTGAKGGFYPKQLPDAANREAWLAEGTESYRIFIRTLLSVTDNLVEGTAVHPAGVVCYDGDDPYFVVAADKGTATFSDTANAIALERGFWLGDAFASGGSVGYDHKAMGITAKGGWVSVVRHFAEMGVDVQSAPVRVAGCGDMSGDVFGNGMLLSKSIKLVAAFDHRHIFIDPNPDPALSWAERARMFALPRSSWADYDGKLISKGGGVFPRSAKSIKLTKEMRDTVGVDATELDPSALIAAILKSPVDLMWFGGIGTYVKARGQSNSDVGDRANDAHRVNAEDLRCKVIGEGANLGVTQAARIAYGLRGGRSNTDFIDNSAGVDCSDHEVNIKIALSSEIASGRLGMKARNALLARMTADVAALVLEDNRLQTLALSIAGRDGPRDLPAHIRVMEGFEAAGHLDRVVEGIGPNEELLRRASDGKGLTRPELAVLLSTAKLALQADIEKTDLGTDPATLGDLIAAFPTEMRRKHVACIEGHPLRKEIIATKVANRIVNRMGIIHPFELAEESGTTLGDVAEAFVIAEQVFGIAPLWAMIDEADMAETTRLMLFEQVAVEMRAHMADILRNTVAARSNDQAVAAYAPIIATLSAKRTALLPPEAKRQITAYAARLSAAGTPTAIADRVVRLAELDGSIGIAALAARSGVEPLALTSGFTLIGDALGIDWAQGVAMQLDPQDPWERLLSAGLARDFQAMRLDFVARLGGADPLAAVENWLSARQGRVAAFKLMVTRAQGGGTPTPAMLAQIAGQARVLLSR